MRAAAGIKKTWQMLIIQAVILLSTAITAGTGVLYGAGGGQDGDHMIGLGYFKAFTMDSNILAGICALVLVCYAIGSLMKKEDTMPRWASFLQLAAANSLFLTMVTVVFFLAPIDVMEGKSYFNMFSDDMFIFHLTNPLLAIYSFVFSAGEYRFQRKDCIWGVLPMAVYAAVYLFMVVVFKKWKDFYGFTFGGRNDLVPLVIFVMLLLTWLLARLLVWMNSRASHRKERKESR